MSSSYNDQNWIPPDLSAVCRVHSTLTTCAPAAYMYLNLIANLFGRSKDSQSHIHQAPIPQYNSGENVPQINFGFDPQVQNFGTGGATIETHSFGNGGSGISKTTYYDRPSQELGFAFDAPPSSPNVPFTSFFDSPAPFQSNTSFFDESQGFLSSIDNGFEKTKQSIIQETDDYIKQFSSRYGSLGTSSRDKPKVIIPKVITPQPKRSRKKRQNAKDDYDFIIVGAGSAGCVLANRLSEVKKWRILLLEAGIEEPEITSVPAMATVLQRSSIDWMYRTQPQKHACRSRTNGACYWARGKVMGGSSAINYMIYMRGNRQDYDEWAEFGNHGWSYEEVLPYFKKAENNEDEEAHDKKYHGKHGPLNVERYPYLDKNVFMITEAFKEKGLKITDPNAEEQIGVSIAQSTSKHGRRSSTNVAYIRPIRYKRPNLVILTQAHVTRLLIDPHSRRAVGVEYFINGKVAIATANKEVLLSAGAINTPKILMLSGIGPKEFLQPLAIKVIKELKVGYNLQDHVTTDAALFELSNKTATAVTNDQLNKEIYYYYHAKKKDGPLAATGPLSAGAFIQTKLGFGHDVPDIQYHFDGRNLKDFLTDPVRAAESGVYPLAFYDSINARPILVKPKSRGLITLNTTHPLWGPPLIYPGYFNVKHDLDTMIAGLEYIVGLEYTHAFKKAGAEYVKISVRPCDRYKWGTYEYWSCAIQEYTSTIFHFCCTAKMGPNWDNTAVVSPTLKVYGIKRLRVVDASIMPTIPRGNTNAPVIMIAEKAADIIKAEWIKI